MVESCSARGIERCKENEGQLASEDCEAMLERGKDCSAWPMYSWLDQRPHRKSIADTHQATNAAHMLFRRQLAPQHETYRCLTRKSRAREAAYLAQPHFERFKQYQLAIAANAHRIVHARYMSNIALGRPAIWLGPEQHCLQYSPPSIDCSL